MSLIVSEPTLSLRDEFQHITNTISSYSCTEREGTSLLIYYSDCIIIETFTFIETPCKALGGLIPLRGMNCLTLLTINTKIVIFIGSR